MIKVNEQFEIHVEHHVFNETDFTFWHIYDKFNKRYVKTITTKEIDAIDWCASYLNKHKENNNVI